MSPRAREEEGGGLTYNRQDSLRIPAALDRIGPPEVHTNPVHHRTEPAESSWSRGQVVQSSSFVAMGNLLRNTALFRITDE